MLNTEIVLFYHCGEIKLKKIKIIIHDNGKCIRDFVDIYYLNKII